MSLRSIFHIAGLISSFIAILVISAESRRIPKDQTSGERLTVGKAVIVGLLVLMNPLMNGILFYYGWRKQFPAKAKMAALFLIPGVALLLINLFLIGIIAAR